jgi:hypothetical protein
MAHAFQREITQKGFGEGGGSGLFIEDRHGEVLPPPIHFSQPSMT